MEARLRALVLTAGLGQRLRPLTLECPKALLPVLGRFLVEHTLERLEAVGCEEAALNLHHLGEAIESALGDSYGSMRLRYSHEPELLGTLGALFPLREFLSEADYVLVVNGDSLCDWPLEQLLEAHLERPADTTLLLSETGDLEELGGLGIDGSNRVVTMPGARSQGEAVRTLVFAGAHLFSPRLIEGLPGGRSGFLPGLYCPLLESGGYLQGLPTRRSWHDLGTPRRYLEAVLELAPGSWVAAGAEVDPSAQTEAVVLEGGTAVAPRAHAERSLLLAGSALGEGASVVDVIVGPRVQVPAGTTLSRCLVTNAATAGPRLPHEERLGELVLTPFDGA